MPPAHRTRTRSKWDRKPFVRKAAFMSVGRSVPRMVAYPPSPPPRGGRSGYRRSGGASSGAKTGSGAEPGSGTAEDGEGDEDEGWVVGGGSGQQSEGEADAAVARVVGKDPGAAAGESSAAAAADALANQLSARGHNPRLFPAACWLPGAPSVLAAAIAQRAGLPPIAPGTARGILPAGANSTASSARAATPPPPPAPSAQVEMPSAVDDQSSEDMEDDELVMAYVTPPASPVPTETHSV